MRHAGLTHGQKQIAGSKEDIGRRSADLVFINSKNKAGFISCLIFVTEMLFFYFILPSIFILIQIKGGNKDE